MDLQKRKLVTVVTEAAIERLVIRDIMNLGAKGYTVVEARGEGSRGRRNADWEQSRNSRIEIICEAEIADAIARHLATAYHDNYAMVIFMTDAEVLRPQRP